MLAMAPVFVTLLSAGVGHERVLPAGWLGVVLSVVGIALVLQGAGGVQFGAATVRGDLIMIGAAVAWAVYTVGSSPLVQRHGALPVTAATMWIGAALLLVVAIPSFAAQDWSRPTTLGWTALFASGALAVGLSYVLWYHGVQHLGSARTAVFSNTVPIVALITAWITLGERPGRLQIAGAGLIVGGVLITRLRGTERACAVTAR
jgi:drug/metabolite transporter (DMT)-like permease